MLKGSSTDSIRQQFIKFFVNKGHVEVPSSSLVPSNDSTLLFTNAGMNQFKEIFLGAQNCEYSRAVSVQKCMRAGGKHNDLDNVGYTARHHTFFEMLGNFSFGDYFKKEAILYAWEFLTCVLKIPVDKLYITTHETDDESYKIWTEIIGLSSEHIIIVPNNEDGSSDNFWQMGDTGPCGPCTEIFYDHGDEYYGTRPGIGHVGDRYIEIWNCVFMEYNRDTQGNLNKLPKLSVDTGMGLERISAVIQHVNSNYKIDVFVKIIDIIQQYTDIQYSENVSFHVIADHIRAIIFLIYDLVLPNNEGRGYVLRRIMRRAMLHGFKINIRTPFLHKLVPGVVGIMHSQYPELSDKMNHIQQIILDEEQKFSTTIEKGIILLENELRHTKDKLSGHTAFKLYDTYGFPLDLTINLCNEQQITVDVQEFENAMQTQQQLSRCSSKFKVHQEVNMDYVSEFIDYDMMQQYEDTCTAHVIHTYNSNERTMIILDHTICYPESGGQVGDTGQVILRDQQFTILDTQKVGSAIVHITNIPHGIVNAGDLVTISIDFARRVAIARNHSATHLLNAALRKIFGQHVVQHGSYVCDTYARFDFNHTAPLTYEELHKIELLVNHSIAENHIVTKKFMPLDSAIESGAIFLASERYLSKVRVIAMGDISKELCGGTHVHNTGMITLFNIIESSSVAAGIKRITFNTGYCAINDMLRHQMNIWQLRQLLKCSSDEVKKITTLTDNLKSTQRELLNIKAQLAKEIATHANIERIGAFAVISVNHDERELVTMILDELQFKLSKSDHDYLILRYAIHDQICSVFIVALNDKLHAGILAKDIMAKFGGKGGGQAKRASITLVNLNIEAIASIGSNK